MKKIYTAKVVKIGHNSAGKKQLVFPPDVKYRVISLRANADVALALERLARKHKTSVMAVTSTILADVVNNYL